MRAEQTDILLFLNLLVIVNKYVMYMYIYCDVNQIIQDMKNN